MSARLVLSCEHAGMRVPREHAALFRGAQAVLASHRGWDPGALDLGRRMAQRMGCKLHACTWTRLLVEPNRSPHNPRIWSSFTRALPRALRERILERYWRPHRTRVEAALDQATRGNAVVLHVAVHSFTPVLDGERRNADIGLLFDPSRRRERAFARRWKALLAELAPDLRVRFNYPYLGTADGLTTSQRKRFPDARYAGIELELNQALLAHPQRARIRRALVESVARLVGD
jgi:predicted N-formylglutamate amidohydrolase